MNEETANIYYNTISKQNSYLLKGYVSSLLDFAQFIENNKWEFNKLKAISTTTETLLPNNREYLERVFKVPIFDQYGCGEISAISYECSKHNGLHINQEHVICEILDTQNSPLLNQPGRVIATDLDNYVMPFIRYENGDIATLTDEKCTCGVNQPLMKSIEGRSIDTITLNNGSKVHGVFFTDILFEIGMLSSEFQKFQIVQNKIGSIEFRLETQKTIDNKKKEQLNLSLSRFFDSVDYVEVLKLKNEPNGKFKYIINNIGHN
jgi:phenylacetate-CoA ligase